MSGQKCRDIPVQRCWREPGDIRCDPAIEKNKVDPGLLPQSRSLMKPGEPDVSIRIIIDETGGSVTVQNEFGERPSDDVRVLCAPTDHRTAGAS